jgi:hypothetical protein
MELVDQPPAKRDIRCLIFVNCTIGWYLAERSYETENPTGLEQALRKRSQEYLGRVDVWIRQLPLLIPPSILSIITLLCCVSLIPNKIVQDSNQ